MGKAIEQPARVTAEVAYAKVVAPPIATSTEAWLSGKELDGDAETPMLVALPPGLEMEADKLQPPTPDSLPMWKGWMVGPGDEPTASEAEAARGAGAGGGGLGGLTTAMIRHLPPKLTQERLVRLLRTRGLAGQFDFVYVPIDSRRKTNRGIAFVNFMTPEAAEEFFRLFSGLELLGPGGEKPLEIIPADVQGFEANAAKHTTSADMAKRHGGCPMFFRPRPKLQATAAALAVPAAQKPSEGKALFCGYCGNRKKATDHTFCPFCGGRLPP